MIHNYGVKNVVIEGFNEKDKSMNVLFDRSDYKLIQNEYINTKYTHSIKNY